ncbi:MAG: DegV family protein, partial [Firmicutes bacterium]|nr:DegV family protein [Bacillota bacterium]
LRVQGEIGLCQLSPVIAAHTGPGTLGVAVGPSV